MKILFITRAHAKIVKNMKLGFEKVGIKDVIYKNSVSPTDIQQTNVVYSAQVPLPIHKYPNTLFIFGPNFSVFPSQKTQFNNLHKNAIYIQPSTWVCQFWRDIGYNNLPLHTYAVGVDTELFHPDKDITNRKESFIYFKHRSSTELQLLQKYFPTAKIFVYGKYNETDYLAFLKQSKYGIWLAAHESEGFALLEALSCNVPLLVWNVNRMTQEMGQYEAYKNITTTATTIPYWDSRCGEIFYDENFETKDTFFANLENYKPREYILDNLTVEKTAMNFINLAKSINNLNL
jgi:glycosyltransferase involved in cell wall biosynthesis